MKSFLSRHYESFGPTVLVILVLSLFVASGTMAATYEQEQQSLYQAAKTEGKVILYTSGDTVEMQKMLKAFETSTPVSRRRFIALDQGPCSKN